MLRKGLTRGYIGTPKLAPIRDRLSKGKSVWLDSVNSTDTARGVRHDESLATTARELLVDTIKRIVKVASETMAQRDEPALGECSAKHRGDTRWSTTKASHAYQQRRHSLARDDARAYRARRAEAPK